MSFEAWTKTSHTSAPASKMTKKYVLRSGWVISANDGQRHYITAEKLVNLYKVNPEECILEPDLSLPQYRQWKPPQGAIYLTPRSDGNYLIPNN